VQEFAEDSQVVFFHGAIHLRSGRNVPGVSL